jgi:hypothetical protein
MVPLSQSQTLAIGRTVSALRQRNQKVSIGSVGGRAEVGAGGLPGGMRRFDGGRLVLGFGGVGLLGFILGFVLGGRRIGFGVGVGGAFVARERAQHDIEAASDQAWLSVGVPVGCEFLDEILYDFESELLVSHFTTSESEGGFDLHVIAEEIDGMADFDTKIMGIDGGGELDFLHAVGVLVFFGFLVALGQFVSVLAVVDQSADRRGGVGRDLDQIDSCGASHGDRVAEGQDPELASIGANDAYFAGTDLPIDSGIRTAGRGGTRVGALQDTPVG